MVPVLTVRTFTRVTPSCAGIEPALDGEGADARQDVSAIRRGVDHVLVGQDLREQEIDIDVLLLERLTIATFDVKGCAPPSPSTWRASGEPMSDEQDRVARLHVARQVVFQEIGALGGAAPDQHASDRDLHRE